MQLGRMALVIVASLFATGVSAQAPSCSIPAPDFGLSASPASQSITAGSVANYSLSMYPWNALSGTVALTITGLPSGLTATVNGSSTLSIVAGSSTLALTASAHVVAGTYPLTLTGAAGSAQHSVPLNLSLANLIISSVTPASGPVGTTVTINGSGFGSSQGNTLVLFGGSIEATPTSWSPTQIVAPVPSGAMGNGVQLVNNELGLISNVGSFTVPPSVTITSVSPNTGLWGTPITITGTGFGSTQGTTLVAMNGAYATPTSWSNTSIVAPVPTGATAAGGVSVGTSAAVPFSVPAVSITSLSVTSGAVGVPVTITGTNFGASQGTGTVTFNGVQAHATTWSNTSIVTSVPTGSSTGNVVVGASNGQASNGVSFAVTSNAAITALSPTAGVAGTAVTITGANFGSTQGTSTVKFNGTAATPTSWSATSIVVPVPTGATDGNVVVSVGGIASNGVAFDATATIISLSPTSGVVGTVVTITGVNFGTTTGQVYFSGSSGATPATPTSWTNTQIVVPVPVPIIDSGEYGGGNIFVVIHNSSGYSNYSPFTMPLTPYIGALYPTEGAVGTVVTINGGNFGATRGTSTVTINGATATPTSWSANSIVVSVPTGATASGYAVVTVSGAPSWESLANAFKVFQPPTITSLSSTSGPFGQQVTITGSNFIQLSQGAEVMFNGTVASQSSITATTIVVSVPSGASSGNVTAQMVLTTTAAVSNGVNFTVTTPSISVVSPSSGPIGIPLTIAGAGFGSTKGTSTVTILGATATPSSWSNTAIVVPVPAAAQSGSVTVSVNGLTSNSGAFTLNTGPGIDSLSPTSGPPGTPVKITGTSFGSPQGSVTFNGSLATATTWNNTTVWAVVPPGATTGNIVLTASQSEQPTNGMLFTVTSPTLSVTSTSPSSGLVGTSVTVTGSGFGSTQGTSTVSFNGAFGTPTSWSNTTIVVPVPAAATSGNVDVTVGGVTGVGPIFTVNPPPIVASLSPLSGLAGSSVTVAGANFGATQGTSTVKFNGIAATATSWGATSITAVVPTGATTGSVVVTVGSGASNAETFTVP